MTCSVSQSFDEESIMNKNWPDSVLSGVCLSLSRSSSSSSSCLLFCIKSPSWWFSSRCFFSTSIFNLSSFWNTNQDKTQLDRAHTVLNVSVRRIRITVSYWSALDEKRWPLWRRGLLAETDLAFRHPRTLPALLVFLLALPRHAPDGPFRKVKPYQKGLIIATRLKWRNNADSIVILRPPGGLLIARHLLWYTVKVLSSNTVMVSQGGSTNHGTWRASPVL